VLFTTHLVASNYLIYYQVYLVNIRQLHVSAGFHEQFSLQLTLDYSKFWEALKGSKVFSSSDQNKTAYNDPTKLKTLSKEPPSFNNVTLWEACYMAFFGFLRVGEFTVSAKDNYDKSSHLSLYDSAIDSSELLCITIKQSKTDPSRTEWKFVWMPQTGLFALLWVYCHTWQPWKFSRPTFNNWW